MEVIIKVKDPKNPVDWIDVELVNGCTWETITTALSTQLELLSREEIISVQSIDADGEPLSAKINSGPKFWAIVGNSLDGEDLWFEIQHDAALAEKLANALAYEEFRASAAHLCFSLASDVEQVGLVYVKFNCPWDELVTCVAKEFSNFPADWIHHFTLVDNEGDELSDVLNTDVKFWKFASTYNRESGNIFVIHFDETKIAEMSRLEEEAKFRAAAQKIRVRLAKTGEAPQFGDVFLPKHCDWEDVLNRTAPVFDVKSDWIRSFYFLDSSGEKLSSNLTTAAKFWKFAGDFDHSDSSSFDMILDWDALAEAAREKEELEFQANACKISVVWKAMDGTSQRSEVFLPRNCSWAEVVERVAGAVDIPPEFVSALVWLDSDGDELSPKLSTDTKFWRLADKFNFSEGQYYNIIPNATAVAEAEQLRLEKEFEDMSKSFQFGAAAEPGKVVDIAISPRHTNWEGLIEELAGHFPPMTVEWICGLTFTYEGSVVRTNIESIEKLWESYEHLRGRSSAGGVSMESIMQHGRFLVNEHPEFREEYEREIREAEQSQQAAEQARQMQQIKENSKEIIVDLAGMSAEEQCNVFVPLTCNAWEDLIVLIADAFPSIEKAWISYVILVDHMGEELSVPITDIQKFWKLCGDEYTVLSGYRFMIHLNQDLIAEAMALKEYADFKASAAQFTVKFQYLDVVEAGVAYVNHNCDWDELILAVCHNLNNLVNAATIDYVKMKDETGEDISSPIRSSDKFWLVFPTYNRDEGMYFEVFDSESAQKLEQEAMKSEMLAGRVACRFKFKDPDSLDFSDELKATRETVEVLVPANCGWDELCDSIALTFDTIPPTAVKHFVLVDSEGDELSMVIDNSAKFWKISDSYNLNEGFTLMLYVDAIVVREYLTMVARKRFEATAANFRVFVQKDDGSKGPELEIYVNHDCMWSEITVAILEALDLVLKGVDLKNLVLVDMDGDALSPALTNESKFWKIYHKNKKVFSQSIMFAAQLVKTNLIDQLNTRKGGESIRQSPGIGGSPETNLRTGASPAPLHSSLLEDACLKGDIAAALSLLNSGADVNSKNEAGTEPIHFASVIGSVELARLLIAAGADVCATNNEGSTPLHFACEQGHEDLILFFISANASLTTENSSGIVPLDYLCSQGNDELVLEVMKYLPDFEYGLLLRLAAEHGIVAAVSKVMNTHITPVDGEDADQRTAMHFACLNGNYDVAKVLISHGANIRSKDVDGMTPALYACSSGNLKLVKYLLARGSTVLLGDVDTQGNTCLHVACHLGHLDLAQFLVKIGMDCSALNDRGMAPAAAAEEAGYGKIDKWIKQFASKFSNSTERSALGQQLYIYSCGGAVSEVKRVIDMGVDVNCRGERDNTPFHAAVANGYIEVARLLFDAACDVNAVNAAGYSPLMVACMNGHLDIVRWLFDIGVDLRFSVGGSYAIHFSALMGKIEVVEFLLDNGCDVSTVDASGATPMHEAAQGNSLDVARLLFERGGDVNVSDRTGLTPIHIAAFRGNSILVQWLLFSGADIECVDSFGRTPFLYSCMGGELKTSLLLDEKNADIHVTTSTGNSAMHLAAARSHVHIIDWLIGKGLDVNALNSQQQTPYQVSLVSCSKGTTDFFGSYFLQTNAVEPEAVVYQVAYEIFRTTNDSNYPAAFFCLEEIMRRVEPMYRLPGDSLILHFAAAAGHINLIKFLLSKGCPVNCQSSTGRTPLHYAAIKGHVQVGNVLLAAGADSQLKDNTGRSALEYALQHNQSQFAQYIQSRVDTKSSTPTEAPNFLFACLPVLGNNSEQQNGEITFAASDDIQELEEKLEADKMGSAESVPRAQSDSFADDLEWFDLPPVVETVQENLSIYAKHVGEFVARAASTEFVPLDMSDARGYEEAKPVARETNTEAKKIEREDTPANNLHLACAAGNLQNVQTLSGKGTDLNSKNAFGLTPLYIACDKQYGDIAIYLIKKGADLGVVCAPGDTPMHRICARGMSSLLEQVIASNLNIKLPLDVKSTSGLTLLHVAAKAGFIGIMKVLVKHANVMNARDATGKTALHYVCESGNLEMVEFLLVNGAFLNVRDSEGCTPILLAVKSDAFEVCKMLSKNGASTTAEDNEGNTLLHMACKNGNIEIILWLIAGGADKEAKNSELKSPIHILKEGRFVAVLQAIEDLENSV